MALEQGLEAARCVWGVHAPRRRPNARGARPVNIDTCEGMVHDDVAMAMGIVVPRRARSSTVGVADGGAPYGPNASARAVSNTTSRTFGGTAVRDNTRS